MSGSYLTSRIIGTQDGIDIGHIARYSDFSRENARYRRHCLVTGGNVCALFLGIDGSTDLLEALAQAILDDPDGLGA